MSEEQAEAESGPTRSRLASPLIFAYAFILVVLGTRALQAPQVDWDALGYAGVVETWSGGTDEEVHAAAYSTVEEAAGPERAAELRGEGLDPEDRGVAYRQRMAAEPDAFVAQLPFYRGRLVFLALLYAAGLLGASATSAALWLSLLSGVAFGAVLILWTTRYLSTLYACLAAMIAMKLTGATEVMAMATPDMLAAALLLGGSYLLVETRRANLGLTLLLLAVGTRADHVLLAGAVVLWLQLLPEPPRRLSNGGFGFRLVLLIIAARLCTENAGTYGWWTVFHHTFVEYMAFPGAETPAHDYGAAASRVVRSLPMFKAWQPLTFTLLAVAAVVVGWRSRGWRDVGAGLAAAATVAALAHFAFFPALWPRMMLAYWALALIGLCAAWNELERPWPKSPEPELDAAA